MLEYDTGFEALWKIYPKRNGRKTKKHPAYKKWQPLEASDKAALRASVEKHNRQQTWGKYIRDLVTYINQRGWEDDVDDAVAGTPTYHLMADPPHECTRWQALGNRILLRYVRYAGGLPKPDMQAAIEIKNGVIDESSVALDQEIAAAKADNSVTAQADAVWTFVELLVSRLDADLERDLRSAILKV